MNQTIMECFFVSLAKIKISRFIVVFFMVMGLMSSGYAGQIALKFETASKANQEYYQLIRHSHALQEAIDTMNGCLRLKQDITVRFGEATSPLSANDQTMVSIPYDFLQIVTQRFEQDQGEGLDIATALEDVVVHALFHELAHILIRMYDLPVLGNQEVEVENLANVLLLEMFHEGGDRVLNAADLFGVVSQKSPSFSDVNFWDQHGLNNQRYNKALCMVYGHDPEANDELLTAGLLELGHAERCIDEYDSMVSRWMKALRVYWKGD